MPGLESTSQNLYGPKIRSVYQSEPKFGSGPGLVYELEPKSSFKPIFLHFESLG